MVAESYMNRPIMMTVKAPAMRKATTYDDIYNHWLAKTHDHHIAREKADAWQTRRTKAEGR